MNRFDGAAARQLDLIDDENTPLAAPPRPRDRGPVRMRVLRKDLYAELTRRRRRAQIAARRVVEKL
jgi:hypothetical protein